MKLSVFLRSGLFLLAALLAVPAFAAPPQTVTYKSGSEMVKALVFTPSTPGRHPAIVVIHEWWGLNDWVKQQAADLASHGYVALAVDLYRGQVADDADTAHQLSRGLPEDRALRDMTGAVAYLKTRKDVNPARIGAVGWCMGGGYALQLAIHEPDLRAVVINYGALETDKSVLRNIHAQVLGNFGGLDKGITPADVHAFATTMQQLGKPVDVKIYPDAGHAFQNPNNKTGYRAQDTVDAHQRILDFFAKTLQ
ncbi:MAG: dienelactone hydrolase family protein [Acidobacteriaceae bacterium]